MEGVSAWSSRSTCGTPSSYETSGKKRKSFSAGNVPRVVRAKALQAVPHAYAPARTAILAGPLVPRGLMRAFVAVWVAAWILLGVWTGYEVNNLRSLSDTVVKSGSAMKTTGGAIQGLSVIPFVGRDVERVGRQVAAAGASAVRSGRDSRSAVDRLAILLGVAVGLIPTVPVLVLYVLLSRAVVVRESMP